MISLPYVSVVVPVYNMRKTVGETLRSLLNQTYPKDRYEVIVVDNASDDGSDKVIKRYPVRYILEDKVHNVHGARNRGISESRGDLVASCDADDAAAPNWLAELVVGWDNPKIGCLCARHQPLLGKQPTLIARYAARTEFQERYLNEDTELISTGGAAYKREVLEKLGGFDAKALSGGDFMMSWRMIHELGLRFRYNREAIMYVRPRTLFISRFSQAMRYAIGAQRNREIYSTGQGEYFKASLRQESSGFMRSVCGIPYRAIKGMRGQDRCEYVFGGIVLSSDKLATIVGLLHYRFLEQNIDRQALWK